MTKTVAIIIPSAQIITLKYFLLKTKASWKKMMISSLGREIRKMSLEHIVIVDFKKAIKD